MAIETYIAIVACYSLGCFLCYRLGQSKGIDFALRTTIEEIAELSDKTKDEIAKLILEHRKSKSAKAIKS